jgi:hypothetical protein
LVLLARREPEAERHRDDLFAENVATRYGNGTPCHDQ